MKTLSDYQAETRYSYVGGGPGAIISGLVWSAAAFAALTQDVFVGFMTLFFGGMLIFPLGLLVCRYGFKRADTSPDNPDGRIVVETLPGMFFGLFVAYLLILLQPDWVFPVAAMAVGAHYFSFRTAYGNVLYWVLGGLMMFAGMGYIITDSAGLPHIAAIIGAIEIGFGVILTVQRSAHVSPTA